MAPSNNVERIKERLDIVDVIGSYIKLEKSGSNYKARSPFTNEKTPSFFVSPERQLYYCFSYSKGGDMFTFVQDIEGVDFKGSMKILAARAGIVLQREDAKTLSDKDRLFSIMSITAEFYASVLPKTEEAKSYLAKRGLTQKTIEDWDIGYAPNSWRDLRNFLHTKKFSDNDLSRVGLIKSQAGLPDRQAG